MRSTLLGKFCYGVTMMRKRDEIQVASKRQEESNQLFKELKEKHSDKYDVPKLRLWARMMSSNLHDSLQHLVVATRNSELPFRKLLVGPTHKSAQNLGVDKSTVTRITHLWQCIYKD